LNAESFRGAAQRRTQNPGANAHRSVALWVPDRRLARLLDAIAHPERHIARFLKALCKGLRLARLIPIARPAHALAANAPCALAFADTS
jgi:hypothetical protein